MARLNGGCVQSDFSRRITTQDALLDPQTIQKCVEIGPSDTLRAMMKKTLDQKRKDPSFRNAPECLTFGDELEWLNKASEPEVVDEEPEIETANEPIISQPAPVAPTPAVSTPPVAAPQAAAVEIEDLPVTALEAVLAIVASGLKTGQANVDTSQSVKFLAKGMLSTQTLAKTLQLMYRFKVDRHCRTKLVSCNALLQVEGND